MPRGVFPRSVRTCTIEGCDAKHKAKGLCMKHYLHSLRHSDPLFYDKQRERTRRYRERYPDGGRFAQRQYGLMRRYGLTIEQFDVMVDTQEGRCAICDTKPQQLVVDHCHASGVVRGLLCQPCNRGLGAFRDDPKAMRRAASYIEQPKTGMAVADGWKPEAVSL